MPAGYRHLHRISQVGFGQNWFLDGSQRLFTCGMHRRAGLEVNAESWVSLNQIAFVTPRLGPLHFDSPVRVVDIVDRPGERGFAYGTLAGHPEVGEERFIVRINADGIVWAEIRAFSRPGRWYTRMAGPAGRHLQDAITTKYLHGLTDGRPMPCPCCERRTLPQRGEYDLCPICNWEDDPNQSRDPTSADGANGQSLVAAKLIYQQR